jgi:hypothetical protein
MKKIIFLLSFILLILTACKKTNENQVCYECKDASGNYLETDCGKNEQEAFDKSGVIGGVHDITVFRQWCKKK